jgi:hypothetical protein
VEGDGPEAEAHRLLRPVQPRPGIGQVPGAGEEEPEEARRQQRCAEEGRAATVRREEVEPGEYFLACLPLKLAGSDGSPARAILVRNL